MFKTATSIVGRVNAAIESKIEDVIAETASAAVDGFIFGLQRVVWTRAYQIANIITKKCRHLYWKKMGFFYIKFKNIYEFFRSVSFSSKMIRTKVCGAVDGGFQMSVAIDNVTGCYRNRIGSVTF